MDTLEFHIIPVLNVDGYIYTHNRERMVRYPVILLFYFTFTYH